jgi:hypothetical protein
VKASKNTRLRCYQLVDAEDGKVLTSALFTDFSRDHSELEGRGPALEWITRQQTAWQHYATDNGWRLKIVEA